MIYLMQITHF